ncbi:hypothetical protein ACJ73_08193 [Blastomyces percursus]|uniref:Uncharacterized protein n=1 Tax=Blastomyces percursus TaxID=1658174 RepID=A0A1J9PW03_9EURO|nr:hypothetical protein ACJ73_08193 [Blastomyces percursus]
MANVPNYAVVQEDVGTKPSASPCSHECNPETNEGTTAPIECNALAFSETRQLTYKELIAEGEDKLHEKLRTKRGRPLGWAMIMAKRIPAMIDCGALYGIPYDIHAAQIGISGTPEGKRI